MAGKKKPKDREKAKRKRRSFLIGLISWFAIVSIPAVSDNDPLVFASILVAWLIGWLALQIMNRFAERNSNKALAEAQKAAAEAEAARLAKQKPKKSYGPEIDPILEEGNKALSEMGRLYMSISDPEVKKKINELMRVTDKITQDAIDDPSDIPQIKKFMNYYLPTTLKLLNSYDRMSSQGINGENIDKSMDRINEMLDVAIDAYKKRLDSLYANNALDIETDIDVMNQMLAREGLADTGDTLSFGGVQYQTKKE